MNEILLKLIFAFFYSSLALSWTLNSSLFRSNTVSRNNLKLSSATNDGEVSEVPKITESEISISQQVQSARSTPSTLDKFTPWRLFLSFRDPDGNENDLSTKISVVVRFLEDQNFEPPQGRVEVLEENPYVRIDQSKFARWTLSEDPDDRKDGLWVWGLFKEPLYPFLLFQLEINEIPLPDKGDGKIRKIPAGKLYGKVPHRREKEAGAILRRGDIGVKYTNIVSADLAGLATADIGEVKECGSVLSTPLQFAPGISF